MIKVYIASPYTKGDVDQNVRVQIDASHELMNKGFLPFAPLLYHFQGKVHPRPYEDWMKVDFGWLSNCDVVLRLPGESKGADREVELAKLLNIPVFDSIDSLCEAGPVGGTLRDELIYQLGSRPAIHCDTVSHRLMLIDEKVLADPELKTEK